MKASEKTWWQETKRLFVGALLCPAQFIKYLGGMVETLRELGGAMWTAFVHAVAIALCLLMPLLCWTAPLVAIFSLRYQRKIEKREAEMEAESMARFMRLADARKKRMETT